MAKLIGIIGESGSGKTTSMRNLPPETTYYIDADKKGLSWKGWKKDYEKGRNYLRTDNAQAIFYTMYCLNTDESMRAAWSKANQREYKPLSDDQKSRWLSYNVLVIDTLNAIMIGEEMRRSREKGYDKWIDIASYIYSIVDYALTMRDDLTVITVCHSETIQDDVGNRFTRIKTNGRKLEKIVLESKMPTVLLASGQGGDYQLLTRAPDSTCKAPMGALEASVPNDITEVLKALEDY